MTNLDFLKTLKTADEVENFLEHCQGRCLQSVARGEEKIEIHKHHCLNDKYRGVEGCRVCRHEFWNRELIK